MITLAIQLKTDLADTAFTPQETGYWLPCLVASAQFLQQLNLALEPQLIHGPIPCNPVADHTEGYLGNINTPPNEFGVVQVRIENYAALKIPFLPPEAPFVIYLGDTSERKEIGTDEAGNPIYETVLAGSFSGD